MKFYNQSTHRSISVKSSEVNISGTRVFRDRGVCAIAVHGKPAISLNGNSSRSRRIQNIIADNHRKDWERKFKELV